MRGLKMQRNCLFLVVAVTIGTGLVANSSYGILLDGTGAPDPSDPLLYAWYDGNEALGADGIAETPIWPNKQGDELRDITSGFGPDGSQLNLIEDALNGNAALEYIDLVTWAEAGNWGTLDQVESGITVFAVANMLDPNQSFLFQGNQGGNQGAGAWANFTFAGDELWEFFAGEVVESAPLDLDTWLLHTFVFNGENSAHYLDGELVAEGDALDAGFDGLVIGGRQNGAQRSTALHGEYLFYDDALPETDRQAIEGYLREKWFGVSTQALLPGDANMDLEFNQLDLVQVQVAAKYLTGESATWGEGDWDGAPGGEPGNPPQGDGQFSQLDIIAALGSGAYLTGPYAAVSAGGESGDGQTSIGYDAGTGELFVDPPEGVELTSINVDSASGIFTGSPAENLGGSFDNDADQNIFKATFGGSFGALSFGQVAPAGLSEEFLRGDLSVVGSLAGGGDLGPVDLIYIPEPSAVVLLALGGLGLLAARGRGQTIWRL
jgi:hypothetical protein